MANTVLDQKSAALAKHNFTTISTAIWPILLIASLGMLIIGGAVAVVTRIVIEQQTEQWIEKSIRTSGSTRVMLIDRYCSDAKVVAQQISSRLLVRQNLELLRKGTINLHLLDQGIRGDLATALREAPEISGLSILDLQNHAIFSIGRIPSVPVISEPVNSAFAPMLSGTEPVIPISQDVRDGNGAITFHELIFYRIRPITEIYERNLGFGMGLTKRLAAMIDGKIVWIIPSTQPPSEAFSHDMQALLKRSPDSTQLIHSADGALSTLVMPSTLLDASVLLTADANVLAAYKGKETNTITIAVCSLVAFGTIVMFFLLRPTAIRIVNQIKDHERAVMELQRSEEFNHRITASTPDCIMTLDRSGRILSINRYGLSLLDVGELAGLFETDWLLLWNIEDKAKAQAAVNMAVTNKPTRFRGGTLTGKGVNKWWDIATAPMLDANGAVERVLAVCRDITEEKATQRSLAISEERMRFVASATNDALWDWSFVNGDLWCNEGVEVIFGYPRNEVGKNIEWLHARIHPDDKEQVRQSIAAAVASDSISWQDEYRFRCADGSYKQVLDRGYVMRDHYGNAIRMIGAMFDLSERRKSEELMRRLARLAILRADISALLVNAARQRPMLQSCSEAILRHLDMAFIRIWILDAASNTLVLEASAGLFTQLDGAHARIPVGTFKIGQIAQDRLPHLTNSVIGDPAIPDQEWAQREGLVAFAGYPLLAGDILIGVLGMFSKQIIEVDTFDALASVADLIAQGTRKAALEQEISRQTKVLLKTNMELEQFTYVASHDIQEPLRTITNYLTILDSKYRDRLDEKAHRYIDFAVSATKRLQSLIKDLFEYSKADHQGAVPDTSFAANDIVIAVVSSLESAITNAHATIDIKELPTIRYHPTQFGQVMQNIIENSIKYRGTAPPVITISAQRLTAEWDFSIQDNGIGIDPAYFSRIFDVFQRLHGQEVYQGTGIGLALCKKIVVAHGGRIWVESEPGRGSTFHFTIPD